MIESPIALAPWLKNREAFRRSGSVVEGSRTGLRLDKHLNKNNSDRSPCRSTESNWKPLSKGIESPTVPDVGNTEALRGRHKNVTGRSYRSFGNPAACTKQDPIPFPPYEDENMEDVYTRPAGCCPTVLFLRPKE